MTTAPEPRWDRPTLVGCAPSSGSTLFSGMLDAHPDVLCGPDLSLFSHPHFWLGEGVEWATRLHHLLDPTVNSSREADWVWDGGRGFVPYVPPVSETALEWYGVDVHQVRGSLMAGLHPQEAIRTIMGTRLARAGKAFWAEKSPANLYGMNAFLRRYPEGRGIAVVRDGRDVICSLLNRGWNFWRAVATWLVEAGLCMSLSRDRRVLVVKYEDLVKDARGSLSKVCEFLGLPDAVDRMANPAAHSDRLKTQVSLRTEAWTSRPDQPVNDKAIGRWRKELSPLQLGMLSTAAVIRNVPGLEEIGGVTFLESLRFFEYSDLGPPPSPLPDAAVMAYAQALTPPGFPTPFPMTYVDLPSLSGGRQLVGGMLFWIEGQIDVLTRKNRELEQQLEVLRAQKAKLEHKLLMKTGRVGALRELAGRNRDLDAT